MRYLFMILFMFFFFSVYAQKDVELTQAGIEQTHKGNFSRAITLFDKALKINPKNIKAIYNKGFIRENQNRFEEAAELYSIIIDLEPKDIYYFRRGYCYFQSRQYQEALDDYNLMLKKYPDDNDLLMKRIRIYIQQKQWNKVLSDFDTYLEKDPDDFIIQANRAKLLINLKREKEAHTILEKLIQKYPDETIILNSWAFSLLKQGLADKALQNVNKALKIKPSYAAAYITRAQIFLELGEKEKACKDYTQAQKLGFPIDQLNKESIALLNANCKN
ncbi:tetratricopeptide repeat protein [uncultured Sanguibacteroides sp.]|uniref:tetratricopeptide repeat protein n=1 Tax=uncultured Sanguibacteroides sp. TaxID=1635151 RepID=UPI0025CD1EB6|nr:tetratricopeptide repeat protein [uncultured Sanguibacteroides sp.]